MWERVVGEKVMIRPAGKRGRWWRRRVRVWNPS
jgi:hypothetical protein